MTTYNPILLRSFLAVVQARSFTKASSRLGLRQSTVSQHIRRLEGMVGRRLLIRDTHTVSLTPDGDMMLRFARGILDVQERAQRYFSDSELRGKVRFGVSEDFVLSDLPHVLREFRRSHPLIDLELTVGLADDLCRKLDSGQIDLMLAKRATNDDRGELVWREKLVWVAGEDYWPNPDQPLPLVVFPEKSITRDLAIEALERAGRSWRIVCTSQTLSGIRAAVLGGLGVSAQSSRLTAARLAILPSSESLPELGHVEFIVAKRSRLSSGPVLALQAAIVGSRHQHQLRANENISEVMRSRRVP